jgi:hypothetical protein
MGATNLYGLIATKRGASYIPTPLGVSDSLAPLTLTIRRRLSWRRRSWNVPLFKKNPTRTFKG